ncbi:hypothetical protein [Archangium sp. Cb G35]|nr:hypothetical protein [Archangium sp. Cb G35]
MKTIEANASEKHSRAFWAIQVATVLFQLLQLPAAIFAIRLTLLALP